MITLRFVRSALLCGLFAASSGTVATLVAAGGADLPSISIADGAITEGNAGTAAIVFQVTLSATSSNTVTVQYTTTAGSATANTDYTTASGTLNIAPGQLTGQIAVSVLGDTTHELHETFLVTLSGAVNGNLADASALGQIIDDDEAPADPTTFQLYREKFASGSGGFYFYPVDDGTRNCIPGEEGPPGSPWSRPGCRSYVPQQNGYVESTGPWWVDPNHRYDPASQFPGLGFLNVLAFVYPNGRQFDLRDARVSFDIMVQEADLKGGQIRFWFQAPCTPSSYQTCEFAFADYVLDQSINDLLTPNAWTRLSFNLPNREDAWDCLGTHPAGAYGCVPLEDALRRVENFGFVLVPIPADPAGTNSASGKVRFDDIVLSRRPAENVKWTRVTGTQATDATVRKTSSSAAWNAGAVSKQSIVEGDGFVEFAADGTTSSRMAGLTSGDGSAANLTIDFALHLSAAGRVEVYEDGALVADVGTYQQNDRFRIAIEEGVVKYRRNGTLLGTSSQVPLYPLRFDTVFFTPSGRISNAVVSGALARDPIWTLSSGLASSGNTITKTGTTGWNAGAASTEQIPLGSGFVDFTAAATGGVAVGLSTPNVTAGYTDISFAIALQQAGAIEVFESGVSKGTFGTWQQGDRFRVAVDAGTIQYSRNGSTLYTSVTSGGYPLQVDSSLYTVGSSVNAVLFGAAIRPSWSDVVGLTASNTSLVKTAAASWDAGAISSGALLEGDGYAEFTAAGPLSYRIAGLSIGNSSASYEDVDFGILLTAERDVTVYESGVVIGTFGTYSAGDRFRVGVEGGRIRYYHNSNPIYTSTASFTYPLIVDTSFFESNAEISDVVLAGEIGSTVWATASGAVVGPASLTKSGASGWNAGGVSARTLGSADGFVEFVASETNTHRIVGLSTAVSVTTFTDIAFGMLMSDEGQLLVYESGSQVFNVGAYSTGDRLRVATENGGVRYWRNGKLLYTSAATPPSSLKASAALFTEGATVSSVVFVTTADSLTPTTSPVENVTWISATEVTQSGTTLTKAGTGGWTGAAVSSRALMSGSGSVNFVASGPLGYRSIGLSAGDSGVGVEDISFSILLTTEAQIVIYEDGVFRGVVGTYASGDSFRISVTSGLVQYWHNGGVVYQTTRQPEYPLLVDTSFFTNGSSIADVTLAGDIGDAFWTSAANVSVFGTTLTKTSAVEGWNAGGISTRLLTSQGGFVEFTAVETNTDRIAGLSRGDSNQGFEDVDFGLMLSSSDQVLVYEAGTLVASGGSYAAGDVFRISALDSTVRYWRNGQLILTSTHAPLYPLVVDSSLFTPGATLAEVRLFAMADSLAIPSLTPAMVSWIGAVNVTAAPGSLARSAGAGWTAGAVSSQAITSGDGFVQFTASGSKHYGVIGLSRGDSTQSFEDVDFGILLASEGFVGIYEAGEYRGAVSQYAIGDQFHVAVSAGIVSYWQNGTRIATSVRPPAYPLLLDAALFSSSLSLSNVRMAGTVNSSAWDLTTGLAFNTGTVQKTGTAGWNAGGVSLPRITSGDGFVEFTATETNTFRIVGLSDQNTTESFEDIDFGILLTDDGQIVIYESGVSRGGAGSYTAGSRFRVSVSNGVVRYWRDGNLLYSSATAATYPLQADLSLYSVGATLANLRFVDLVQAPSWNGASSSLVGWTATTGVTTATGQLSRPSGAGWTAGAVSTQTVASGDGYVEFTPVGSRGYGVIGLSHGDSSQSFEDADFGILVSTEGFVAIYEAGEYKGVVAQYEVGDQFRVSVDDGVISYWLNGTRIGVSVRPPKYPLLLDAALFSTALSVTNVGISGTLGSSIWDLNQTLLLTGSSVEKQGPAGWNAGGVSVDRLTGGDGFVEFTAAETNTFRIVGLSDQNTTEGFEDIDFGILLTDAGQIVIYESGVSRGGAGSYTAGSRFRVSVAAGVVRYWHDGNLLFTSGITAASPLHGDMSIYSNGATVADLRLIDLSDTAPWNSASANAVTWTNAVNVQVSGSTVSRISGENWQGGAASLQQISSGAGYMEFTALETNTFRVAGLGSIDSNGSLDDVEFGILLTNGGRVAIYEAGQFITWGGAYQVGDRFRVSVDDGVVRYWQNQTLVHATVRQPGWPLRVDVSLYSSGATVGDVTISGNSQ